MITTTFLETRTVTDPEGIESTVDAWRGDRSDDSATVELTFPAGTLAATVQTVVDGWFAVNMPLPPPPAPEPTTEYIPLLASRDKTTGTISILDSDKKSLFDIGRDAVGNAELQAVDANGNARRILTPQQGTLKTDSVATIADVTFDEPFTEQPVVHMTPSKPLPEYDLKPSKTGFELSFAAAPNATIAWEAKLPRRK